MLWLYIIAEILIAVVSAYLVKTACEGTSNFKLASGLLLSIFGPLALLIVSGPIVPVGYLYATAIYYIALLVLGSLYCDKLTD